MSVIRINESCRVGKQVRKNVLNPVVNQKRTIKRKAPDDKLVLKAIKQGVLPRSKASGLRVANAEKVSVREVKEIVSNYREHTRSKLARDFPMIVDRMLTAAKAGTLTDTKMKLLMDWAGVKDHPEGEPIERRGPSLGELLLNEVRQRRNAANAEIKTWKAGDTSMGMFSINGAVEGASL